MAVARDQQDERVGRTRQLQRISRRPIAPSWGMSSLNTEPVLEPLRSEPRIQALVERVGLPDQELLKKLRDRARERLPSLTRTV